MLHDRGVQGGSGDHRGLVAVGVGLAATAAIALAPSVARADEKTERIVAGAVMAPTMALIGGGFALAEKLFSEAADDHLKTIKEPGNSCAKSPDVCQDIDDDLEAVDDARVGEIVCFSASGALLVTGIILIVDAAVGSKKKSSALAAEVQVAPWAGLEGGGAAVQVRF